jgi:hypothetical protein
VGRFGRIGRYAGQFVFLHNVAVDSWGNVYTSEVGGGAFRSSIGTSRSYNCSQQPFADLAR